MRSYHMLISIALLPTIIVTTAAKGIGRAVPHPAEVEGSKPKPKLVNTVAHTQEEETAQTAAIAPTRTEGMETATQMTTERTVMTSAHEVSDSREFTSLYSAEGASEVTKVITTEVNGQNSLYTYRYYMGGRLSSSSSTRRQNNGTDTHVNGAANSQNLPFAFGSVFGAISLLL